MTDIQHNANGPDAASPAPGLMARQPRQGGYGPVTDRDWSQQPYRHPAAAWGAALSVGKVIARQRLPIAGPKALVEMNHPIRGYDCPGCAWPDDQDGLLLDICENGIKHVTWEMTHKRVGPWFFAAHTVTELAQWTDFELEDAGRLTDPMVYDAELDKYVPISWDAAFALIGEELRGLPTRTRRRSTPPAGSATSPATSTSCSCGNSAPTTCRTAPTCATRRPAAR